MKNIIILTMIFLILSFGFLAYVENKQQSPESQNFWIIYFENPKDKSLDFIINNKSDENNFRWEMLNDQNKLEEGYIIVRKGEKKKINSDLNDLKGRITIKVFTGKDHKEIYKNF